MIIVGRPAYKEWAWALKEGWTSQLPAQRQDFDDELAQTLSEDGAFDEPSEDLEQPNGPILPQDVEEPDGAGAPLPSRIGSSGSLSFNPAFQSNNASSSSANMRSKTREADHVSVDQDLLEPPAQIPAQPPICFVDYVNLTGFRNVPRKIVGFFNHRDRVQMGAQAALDIALGSKGTAREFQVDIIRDEIDTETVRSEPPQGLDLDWGLNSEQFYASRFYRILSDIEKERSSFYKELPRRLQDTRSFVRGERELTASEKGNPPTTEGDLRQERFQREREWRNATHGYNILRREVGVAWHPLFQGSLRVMLHQAPEPLGTMDDEKL